MVVGVVVFGLMTALSTLVATCFLVEQGSLLDVGIRRPLPDFLAHSLMYSFIATHHTHGIYGTHLGRYEEVPLEPDFYRNKDVLILGKGNAAFELANSISSASATTVIVSRSQLRLSYVCTCTHARTLNQCSSICC